MDRFVLKMDQHVNKRVHKLTEVTTYTFSTIAHPAFNQVAQLFLDDKFKRTIPYPSKLVPLITPRALAYWYMDDGGKYQYGINSVNSGVTLNTHGFPEESVIGLALGQTDKYGFPFNQGFNKKKPVIIIPTSYTKQFVEIIKPFMTPPFEGSITTLQRILRIDDIV